MASTNYTQLPAVTGLTGAEIISLIQSGTDKRASVSQIVGFGTGTTTQSANLVYAGPTSGSPVAPTFRSLVLADLPQGSVSTYPLFAAGAGTAPVYRAIATTDLPSPAAGGWYDVAFYGILPNGSDMTSLINSLITTVYNAGGGVIAFRAGTYLVSGQLTIPTDGLSTISLTNSIRITGAGCYKAGTGHTANIVATPPPGGTILDMRYSGSDAKLLTLGAGFLEIDNLSMMENGSAATTTPFILTTNTVLHCHDLSFFGYPSLSGTTCVQDCIVLGGTSGSAGNTSSAAFQGYGTVIENCFANRTSRFTYLRSACNSVIVRDNIIWFQSGTTSGSGAAIEIDGTGSNCDGNIIQNNTIEVRGYPYGIKITVGSKNQLLNNAFWDEAASAPSLAYYRFESGTVYNVIYHGHGKTNGITVVSDANSPTTNQIITAQLGVTSTLPQPWNFLNLVTHTPALTIASGASATLDAISLQAGTQTITGSTHITTAKGFNYVSLYQPTLSAASALTIDNAATLYIDNAPTGAGAGPATITNAYALWVGAGASLLGGTLAVTGATTLTGNLTAPVVIGGTAVSSTLTLQSTSGVGSSDKILAKVGNNGGTVAWTTNTSGQTMFGPTSASQSLFGVSANAAATLPTVQSGTVGLFANADASNTNIEFQAFGTAVTNGLNARSAGGTAASLAATPSGNFFFTFTGFGYDGSAWANSCEMIFGPSELWSSGHQGSLFKIQTTATATTTRKTSFQIDGNYNTVLGPTGAIATNATNGWPYIITSAGAPSGTPGTSFSGLVPVQGDTTNNSLWAYQSSAWRQYLAASQVLLLGGTADAVNFNSGNTDTTVTINVPAGVTRYRIHSITISGASHDISTATCGVFTSSGAGGTAIVTSGTTITVTATAESTNNNMQTLTVNNQSTLSYSNTSLFFRVQTAEGAAATANVHFFIQPLP